MFTANRLVVVFAVGLSAAFASRALAQPNVNPPPPLTGQGPPRTDHRQAALMKCTSGIKIRIRSLRELHDKNGRGSLNDPELPLSHVRCVSLRNGFSDSRPVLETAGPAAL